MVRWGIVGLTLLAAAGCAVDKVSTPSPTGPSELGLSLAITATPDVIRQDGSSQSTIALHARDGSGLGVSGVTVRLDSLVGPTPVDYGTLFSRTLTTDSGGRASTTYQAPAAPPPSVNSDTIVTIRATVLGSNYANSTPRTTEIRLVRPGVIQPPNGAPVPSFFYSPSTVRENETVVFDGSASKDDGQIVSYEWSFGDGRGGTGRTRAHSYELAGSYFVTLTVTDDRGTSVSTPPTPVTVSTASNPVASFTISPTAPKAGQSVVFNAATSTVPTGRTLVGFNWDFGDGTLTDVGPSPAHTYQLPGTYTVVLVVTDNTGRKGVTSRTVTVTEPE